MNPVAVIDASAALSLVLSETGSATVRQRLVRWRRAGVSVQVPSHFWLEVANALARRHRLPSSVVIAAIHRLDEFGLETVELSRPHLLLAIDMSERHALSLYDGAYLALAEIGDGQVLTGDRRLLSAAGTRGISVDGGQHRLSEEPAEYTTSSPSWPLYRHASRYLSELRADAMQEPRQAT